MARTGKIARLKKVHRDQINTLLRDGASAERVIRFVTELRAAGETDGNDEPIEIPNDVNITNWRDGGYQDWLKERGRLDGMRAKRELALEIASQNEGSKIHEAGLHLAASQIFELLEDFDPTDMKELLAKDPENYSRIIGALAKISKEALNFEKYRDAVVAAKQEIQKLRDPKQSLTDDDRKAIVDKVDEILGLK